ncbi:MAG: hypothetical protein JW981_08395 [Anaerolineae bacterium]|nr:hypothetical protein [Anaerolineae bacterium]
MKAKQYLRKICILTLLVFMTGWFSFGDIAAQGTGSDRYYPETQHTLSARFIEYFDKNGGLEIFGYPITQEFIENGLWVQYFQKGRLEYHPENPEPYKIQLGLLGDELKYRQPAIAVPSIQSRRRVYFPETGHTVAYSFLDFFLQHGGIDIFGYPITEMYFENNTVIVQYFQRLKLIWDPEDSVMPVKVGNLGEIYITAYKERVPPEALRALNAGTNGLLTPTMNINSIQAVVSLRYSVMGGNKDQIVSILVTDDSGQPLEGAQVTLTFIGDVAPYQIIYPGSDGESERLITNERGFVQAEVPVRGGQTGSRVIVEAKVTYGNLTYTAENVFLLWR